MSHTIAPSSLPPFIAPLCLKKISEQQNCSSFNAVGRTFWGEYFFGSVENVFRNTSSLPFVTFPSLFGCFLFSSFCRPRSFLTLPPPHSIFCKERFLVSRGGRERRSAGIAVIVARDGTETTAQEKKGFSFLFFCGTKKASWP